jgi:hypothetical protein
MLPELSAGAAVVPEAVGEVLTFVEAEANGGSLTVLMEAEAVTRGLPDVGIVGAFELVNTLGTAVRPETDEVALRPWGLLAMAPAPFELMPGICSAVSALSALHAAINNANVPQTTPATRPGGRRRSEPNGIRARPSRLAAPVTKYFTGLLAEYFTACPFGNLHSVRRLCGVHSSVGDTPVLGAAKAHE